MSVIKAPYNFVPVQKKVVKPYWAKHVSHDVPFADGLSGTLDVTLTAESPIFVKNGMGKAEEEKHYDKKIQVKPYLFNQFQNRYFIPGSSLKGMTRSVLEIMSFGRMENKVNDHKYALRDLSSAMKDEYLGNFKPDKILCGWLKKNDDNSYTLEDCGTPGRIAHRYLDETLNSNFSQYYSERGSFNQKDNYEKSAQKKYELFGNKNKVHQFTLDGVKQDTTGRKKFEITSKDGIEGTLVFTGQPGPRKQKYDGKWTGHHLEFVFFNFAKINLTVPEEVITNFFFAYYEHDKNKWSEDWKKWRIDLKNNNSIPVFFQKDAYGNIQHLGLSYLYKLPFNYSIKDSIQNHQTDTDLDLSEAIFGYIDKEEESLKGRVHFGHAFAEIAEPCVERKEVLAGPKASYYPNYIEQKIENGKVKKYKTFMDKDAVIAGWKRYPIHTGKTKSNQPRDVSEKIFTKFIPLKSGAKFKFKIRFHNLKKIELGALLSALTFHQTENTFHSIGMAKPLGYGKVKLEVKGVDNIKEYLCAYESYMNLELENSLPEWVVSQPITELITMASEHENKDKSGLEYMRLPDFITAKNKDKPVRNAGIDALDRYSNLVGERIATKPICSPEDIQKMRMQVASEKIGLAKLQPPKAVIDRNIEEQKKEVEKLFKQKKTELLKQLSEWQETIQRQEIEKQEEQLRRETEVRRVKAQEKAQAAGIDLIEIDASNKKAFDSLKKVVALFCEKYHNCKEKGLKVRFPKGYLPESEQDVVIEMLKEIHSNFNKKNQQKWMKSNNADFKKVVEWIGGKKAKDIFEAL